MKVGHELLLYLLDEKLKMLQNRRQLKEHSMEKQTKDSCYFHIK